MSDISSSSSADAARGQAEAIPAYLIGRNPQPPGKTPMRIFQTIPPAPTVRSLAAGNINLESLRAGYNQVVGTKNAKRQASAIKNSLMESLGIKGALSYKKLEKTVMKVRLMETAERMMDQGERGPRGVRALTSWLTSRRPGHSLVHKYTATSGADGATALDAVITARSLVGNMIGHNYIKVSWTSSGERKTTFRQLTAGFEKSGVPLISALLGGTLNELTGTGSGELYDAVDESDSVEDLADVDPASVEVEFTQISSPGFPRGQSNWNSRHRRDARALAAATAAAAPPPALPPPAVQLPPVVAAVVSTTLAAASPALGIFSRTRLARRNASTGVSGSGTSSGGGFFRFWIDEKFPTDLSMLQVYKRSQMDQLLKVLDPKITEEDILATEQAAAEDEEEVDGTFEVDCFANCLILFKVPPKKILKYFEFTSHVTTPWLPTCKLNEVAKLLEINFTVSFYSYKNRFSSGKKRTYIGNPQSTDPKTFLKLGRIEAHYVPDTASGWTRWALLNYTRVMETFSPYLRDGLPIDRLRRARSLLRVNVVKEGSNPFRLKLRTDQEMEGFHHYEASWGELLAILTYGLEKNRTPSGQLRPGINAEEDTDISALIEYEQLPMVLRMTPNESMLRTALYEYFLDCLKARSLPLDLGVEEMNKMFEESADEMVGHEQDFLNMGKYMYCNSYLGCSHKIPWGAPPGFDAYSYEVYEDAYQMRGIVKSDPWDLADRMVRKIQVITSTPGATEFKVRRASVKHHYVLIAFDFETTTDGTYHQSYMCSIAYYVDPSGEPFSFRKLDSDISTKIPEDYNCTIKKISFIGRDCAVQMVDYVLENFQKYMITMLAHNLRYDLNQLISGTRCGIEDGIFKSVGTTNCATVKYNHSKEVLMNRSIYHLDSAPIIPMKLAELGKTFDLDVHKEVMPYGIYNVERISSPTYETDVVANGDVIPYLKSGDTLEDFLAACDRANVDTKSGTFNACAYAKYYCEIDCEVLLKGFTINRREIARVETLSGAPCELDAMSAVSISQVASHMLGRSGCFEGTYRLSGTIRDYLASAIVGGRVMVSANLPHSTKDILDDFDACSLYPSAMEQIANEHGGFPKGIPKVWEVGKTDPKDPSILYYVITVKILEVGRPLTFPVLSFMDDNGGRHFTNHLVGKTLTVDKVTWEDAITMQGVVGEIQCGAYFNSGGNPKIGKMVRYLYDKRKELKRAGKNGAQLVMKLVMNSSYGRTIMKPVATEMVFLNGCDKNSPKDMTMEEKQVKILSYLTKHSVSIKSMDYVRDDLCIVERHHSLHNHKSQPHIGAFILSQSKRIMNKVICLAEDIGAVIHYQDTDSMHIRSDDIDKLGEAFYEKYGKPLIARPGVKKCDLKAHESETEELGLFHGDFATVRGYTRPLSVRSVFCGKKMYMDELQMTNLEDGSILKQEHIRMKGIPTDALEKYAKSIGVPVMEVYLSMLEGKRHKIDLLVADRPFFENTKSMKTSTKQKFTREIGVVESQRERAKKEASESGIFLL